MSSFVTFLIFVRPFLLKAQGVTDGRRRTAIAARADFDWPEPDTRREFLRVKWNAQGGLDLYPTQDSAVLTSTAWADGLVDNPAGQAIHKGDTVRFLSLFGALLVKVKVLFFAIAARAGSAPAAEELELPATVTRSRALREHCTGAAAPGQERLRDTKVVRAAVNQDMVRPARGAQGRR